MKNICIISPGLSDGGAEKVSSIIANYFANKKYNVTFISVYSQKKEYFLDKKIDYYYINSKINNSILKMVDKSIRIKKIIKKKRIDKIISFVVNETILTSFKIPTIYSLRIDPKMYSGSKLLRYIAYLSAKKIVFQTNKALDYFSKKIRKKGIVIYNPIDINNLPKWNSTNHKKRFITACRLAKQKNIPMLIDAFCEFYKKHNNFILEIYGDGPLKNELQDYIKRKNASLYITLCGHNPNIKEIMADSSAFILTSDYEGLSNSMLEALCIGVPCICTDCPPGGAKQFITDKKNGLLIPIKDVKALIRKMNYLIDNNDVSLNYFKENQVIRNKLDVDVICKKWENLLME